jgi:hypothetical protein
VLIIHKKATGHSKPFSPLSFYPTAMVIAVIATLLSR